MFSTLPKTNVNFSFTFILSSANAFNLDQSKILSFGKEFKKFHWVLFNKCFYQEVYEDPDVPSQAPSVPQPPRDIPKRPGKKPPASAPVEQVGIFYPKSIAMKQSAF